MASRHYQMFKSFFRSKIDTRKQNNIKVELQGFAQKFLDDSDLYFVYQYGKGGSSTTANTLQSHDCNAIHCHIINERVLRIRERLSAHKSTREHNRASYFVSNSRYRLYRTMFEQRQAPVKIITTLREPDSFLKSVFFQQRTLFQHFIELQYGEFTLSNMITFFEEGLKESLSWIEIFKSDESQLIECLSQTENIGFGFLAFLIYCYLYWFDNELFDFFNITKNELEKQDNFWYYERDNIKGAIVKLEDFDDGMTNALSFLSNMPIRGLNTINEGERKKLGDWYKEFKESAKICDEISLLLSECWHVKMFYGDRKDRVII